MTLHPVTYYRITCDAPGCDYDIATYSDYSAWSEPLGALEEWEGSDGVTVGDKHYCESHRPIEEDD